MPTNEERREVAEKIRKMVEDRYSFTALNVADAIGVEEVIFDDRYAFDEACWLRLADLIEPEPRLKCEWYQDEDGNWHTNCGEIFIVCNCESLEDNNIIYCHNCGGVIEVVEK